MAEIQSSRFTQFYRRLASLKESFTPDLAETVMPTAELVNPFAFDLFRPRGENVVGFTVRVGAIAAQSAQVYVFPGPGMFLVPLWFQATFAAGNTLFVGYASRQSAAFAIGNNVFNLDTRAFGATVDRTGEDPLQMAGAATWGAGTLAPFFAAQNFMRLPPGLAQLLNIGLVLTRPNTGLAFTLDTANVQLDLTFVGYERSFEPQENV